MSESLAAAVEQNSTAIEQMARGVQSVAASGRAINEVASNAVSSATQLDRSIQSVVALVKQGDEVTRRVSRDAEDGGGTIQRSIQGISRLRESMVQSSSVMREMGKRANEIGGIVDTINLIAERTNLLSLNASIEAARAGDAGRGFAVVAEEIRNLADRSAKATSDIAAIIKAPGLPTTRCRRRPTACASPTSNALAESGAAASENLGGLSEITGVVSRVRGRPTSGRLPPARSTAINATTEQARGRGVDGRAGGVGGKHRASDDADAQDCQEVAKAVAQRGRRAHILRRASSTKHAQVHKSSSEQARSAERDHQVDRAMRRGSVSTTRALAEQATASNRSSRPRLRRARSIPSAVA